MQSKRSEVKEIVIIAKKTDKGGWRAAIYSSGNGSKEKQVFAKTPKEALNALIENYIK